MEDLRVFNMNIDQNEMKVLKKPQNRAEYVDAAIRYAAVAEVLERWSKPEPFDIIFIQECGTDASRANGGKQDFRCHPRPQPHQV